jgi:hypothetical protein
MSEKEVTEFIKRRYKDHIKILRLQVRCQHKWEPVGFGYKCEKCGYYTGQNSKLNDLIYELLTPSTNDK